MQGSLSGAIEMLEQISDVDGDENGDESENLRQAKSLFEKGRLLAEAGHFPQAVEALTQSLQLRRAAGSGSQAGLTGLLLGQSFYGMGRIWSRRRRCLREAIKSTPASGNAGLTGRCVQYPGGCRHATRATLNVWTAAREQQAVFSFPGMTGRNSFSNSHSTP